MERKGDKGNGKQTQKRGNAAPIRQGVQGRSHPDGDRTGPSEHRGCQGTWYLHRHPAQLAEGRGCAGRSGRPPEPGQPPDTGAGSGGARTAQAAGREGCGH